MKNVNNWHWVDKNCIVWTRDYFKQKLEQLSVKEGDAEVKIVSMDKLEGDVDLNQRKGKIINIYDFAIDLNWEGQKGDTKASGKVSIPEFMHDTKLEEIVFDVSMDKESKESLPFKQIVKSHLLPIIRQAFVSFETDLVAANISDVFIDKSASSETAKPTSYQPKPPAPVLDSKVESKVLGGVATIDYTVVFQAAASDIYSTLINPDRIRIWTRSGNAVSDPVAGGKFSLFNDNITGEYVELIQNEKIVQKWRNKSWPAGHFSSVTMTFNDKGNSTAVKVVQNDVPIGERDITKTNWHQYYWNPIKSTFGFGAIL
jgi:activator of HSP90 ATPase